MPNNNDPVEVLLQGRSYDLAEIFAKDYRKFYNKWSGELTKELNKFVKANTPNWFNAKFNRVHTPFKIRYNTKEQSLYLWGEPPNSNIDKHVIPKRVKWGKTTKPSKNANYVWHTAHYNRVFIPSSTVQGSTRVYDKSHGFWFTAKKKWSGNDSNVWFTRTSHTDIVATSKGYRKEGKSRKYPYPAMWTAKGGKKTNAYFHRGEIAVSDEVINSTEFQNIIWDTFERVKDKFSK